MKAFEVTGTIDEKGQLILDRPLTLDTPGPVRIIVILPEPTDEDEDDPNDTPVAEVKASLKRAFQEAKTRQRIPLSQMWEGIDRF
ncbi:type II toxin-antitoxin system RelN family antitoxin [Microcoleus sp. D2_18a_D3]|uniref:type II toxin-antitoxin system RelN family antitoxin n=1 Tax=Microcoleus sp. D2_18a_D3 TaxID=3055330 RepID=UPI002FCF1B3B